MGGAEVEGTLEEGGLDLCEQGGDALGQAFLWHKAFAFLAGDVAPRHGHGAFFDILGADFDAHGHTFDFPLVELEAG